jgi:hypothetical protein
MIYTVLKSYLDIYFRNINNESSYTTNNSLIFNYKDGPETDTGYNIQKYFKQVGYYKYHHDFFSDAEKYRSITTGHYRFALGAVLVYDVTNGESFKSCQYWIEQIR